MLSVWKKSALIPPLLVALWLLVDKDEAHKLAVWTALGRHPPSLRVYRALLELTLLLFCTALSFWLWEKTLGKRVVGILLFQPPQHHSSDNMYRPVHTHNDDEILTEEEAQDAGYASDGEVEPTPAYTEPPTAASVANAALDFLLLILVSLFLFTISSAEGGRYIEGIPENVFKSVARIAAPIFPLALFVLATIRAFLPLSKRKDFWIIVSYTVGAPLYQVTFRDGFIGDVLTSSVRPMQDLAFTVFYILRGLQGWWTQQYDLDQADLPVEKSWLLHTCILPACMVSPLWWRFLQNLRQSYEEKQRWPYLGNAFKYFIAAQVCMMGLFDPSMKESGLWITSFVGATLYQIWWDVFMDWELIYFCGRKPRLRASRLYSSPAMYWAIFGINFVLRFCWTLSFLPRWYLNSSGMLIAFDGHFAKHLGPAIASAEIVRRMLWGFLRMEWQAIATCGDDGTIQEQLRRNSSHVHDDKVNEVELEPLANGDESRPVQNSIFRSPPSTTRQKRGLVHDLIKSDMSSSSDLQILTELCLWATAFAALGMVAAAHRETM